MGDVLETLITAVLPTPFVVPSAGDRGLAMTSVQKITPFLFGLLVLVPVTVFAAAPLIVGDGTPASCTEMALKHALIIAETVGGATIRFECGPQPVTIALSEPTTTDPFAAPVMLVLPDNTTVDGGGLITLDGTFTGTVAFVDRDTTVVLKHLSIIAGNGRHGGGGIINFGTLTIDHSTLFGNFAGVHGGGIWNDGPLTVRKSTFEGNGTFFSGGGIFNNSGASLTVEDSTFSGNVAVDFGGGIFGGTVTVDKSTFSDNHAYLSGGGIIAAVTVRKSTFSGNTAVWYGGGIFGVGTVRESTFEGNSTVLSGGGIFNSGTLTIDHSTFSGNTAEWGGGIFNSGTLSVDHSTITQNTANSAGGGIYVCVEGQVIPEPIPPSLPPFPGPCHGTLTLKHTSVTKNTPDDIFP